MLRDFVRLCVFGLLPLAASGQGPASDWPRWRGPDRDGVSRETDWVSSGQPQPLWRTQVGLGYSNVSIADGLLYTLGHDAESGEDRLVCLNALSGERIWTHTYPVEILANFHGGGSLTSPSVEGGVVYFCGRRGRSFALDAKTGAVVWDRDFRAELELADTEYGFAASPVVLGQRVILALGGTLVALEKSNGDVLWRSEDLGSDGYATPVPFSLGERQCLAVFAGLGLVVLDAGSGDELGRYPFRGDLGSVNACTPIVLGKRIFVSAAYGAGSALVHVDESGSLRELWNSRSMRNKVSGCTLWEGHVYGFDESILKCISWEDGRELWRVRGLGLGSVAVAGGRLIILSSRGELIVAEASPKGFAELSRSKLFDQGVFWTTPVLLGGLIYCRSSTGELVCMDHRPQTPTPLASEGSASEPELPGAAELFGGHAARIGARKLAARSSLHLEGSFESPSVGITRTSVVIESRADQWRMAVDLGTFGTLSRCYDGEVAWRLDPFYGNAIEEQARANEIEETRLIHTAIEWDQNQRSMRTTGRARFGGRDCWVVEVESKAGLTRRYYFGVEDGLLAGHEAESEHMVVLSDYREFEGVWLPGRMTFMMSDTGEEESVSVERVAWDVVDAATFERPAEILKLLRTPEEIARDEARLREKWKGYFGAYGTEAGPKYSVIIKDGSLMVEIEGFSTFPMAEPDERGRFYFPPTRIYVTFELDETGVPTAAILHDAPDSPDEPQTLPRLQSAHSRL